MTTGRHEVGRFSSTHILPHVRRWEFLSACTAAFQADNYWYVETICNLFNLGDYDVILYYTTSKHSLLEDESRPSSIFGEFANAVDDLVE